MIIPEQLVIRGGLITSLVTLVGIDKMAEHIDLFNDGHELEIVLWVVGGLLAIIGVLIAAMCKIVWDMKQDNRKSHSSLHEKIDSTGLKLAKIEVEHGIAFRGHLEGKPLENVIADAIKSVMDNHSPSQRHGDCPLSHGVAANDSDVGD